MKLYPNTKGAKSSSCDVQSNEKFSISQEKNIKEMKNNFLEQFLCDISFEKQEE